MINTFQMLIRKHDGEIRDLRQDYDQKIYDLKKARDRAINNLVETTAIEKDVLIKTYEERLDNVSKVNNNERPQNSRNES